MMIFVFCFLGSERLVQHGDLPSALPQFDTVAIHELFGLGPRLNVILAFEINSLLDVAVVIDEVDAIMLHG